VTGGGGWLAERTLSMHSIRTGRREMFYWLAILTTFATGTAVGDLIAEKFSLGYLTTLGLFIVIIAIIAALWKSTPINGVLAFWLAYIMTRPLGASTGDWLSRKATKDSTWAPRPRATCSWARSSRSSSTCRSGMRKSAIVNKLDREVKILCTDEVLHRLEFVPALT
jgi:Repeat of Unknown Function (DUF347)